jgi:hypothetical protein
MTEADIIDFENRVFARYQLLKKRSAVAKFYDIPYTVVRNIVNSRLDILSGTSNKDTQTIIDDQDIKLSDLISVNDAALLLKVTVRTIDRMADNGVLKKHKVLNGIGVLKSKVYELKRRKFYTKEDSAPIDNNNEQLLTRKKVAEIFSVKQMTIYHWERKGLVKPYCKVNGRPRYRMEELQSILTDKSRNDGKE